MTNLDTEVLPTVLGWYTICTHKLDVEGAKQICGRKVYRRLSILHPSGIFMEANNHDTPHVHRKASETVAPLSHLPYKDENIVLDTEVKESKVEVKVKESTPVTSVVPRPVTPPAPVVNQQNPYQYPYDYDYQYASPTSASPAKKEKTGSAIIKGKDAYIPPPPRRNIKRARRSKAAARKVDQG